jgi:hypothetical protein
VVWILGKPGLTLPVLGEFVGVAGNVPEEFRRVIVESVDHIDREFRWRGRWLVGHGPVRITLMQSCGNTVTANTIAPLQVL